MTFWLFCDPQTIRPIEACEQPGVNALDIATTARSTLSTFVSIFSYI